MNFTEGLNHRCGFLSSGGSLVRVIQRQSRRGQNAAEPGKIKTRKPTPLPIACESMRFTPVVTRQSRRPTRLWRKDTGHLLAEPRLVHTLRPPMGIAAPVTREARSVVRLRTKFA